jgi:glycine/D-amino acid oxidase-like deaminating enzyme
MTEASASVTDRSDAAKPERKRLGVDLDVDICVVGAGLAGLSMALEAARMGASVAILEGRHVGWNASGNHFGTVMPGFGLPLTDLIERVGLEDAREMWALSQRGTEAVRAYAAEDSMPGLARSDGALEVSNVDVGDRLIARLQTLGEDFDTEVEGWQIERVRDVLKTKRYFHGVYYPRAFQVDGPAYLRGLASLARLAGVRIFEDTPVVGLDAAGIRKRIVTPSARLRASQVVLAGNVHLGGAAPRLAQTLLPVWRYGAITEPLGERLAEAISFPGSVTDTDGIDQFRIVGGDRLMWSAPETTWEARPQRYAGAIARRIRTLFPQLGRVAIAETFGGAVGQTVHGMPQIGEMRRGLWVASGFGRQGLNTTAMAGKLIAAGILHRDDRWKLFSPFELVWAGGCTGRIAGHGVGIWNRQSAALAGTLARYREGAKARERLRERRLAEANRRVRTSGPTPRPSEGDSGA